MSMSLACDIHGAAGAPPVVLLHGVGGGRRIWQLPASDTAERLAAAGWRVLSIDLPGYGDSPLPDVLSVAIMADAVVHTLSRHGARPAVLVGHSMGGMVAQEVAAREPAAVRALVLACTTAAFGKPDGDWQQAFLRERLAPLDAGLGMAGLAPALVHAMMAPGTSDAVVQRAAAVMAAVPEATYRAALRGIVGFDRRADLPRLGVPLLCLAAGHDRNAPPDVMRRMAERVAGARFTCLDAAGHLANVEQPAAFADALIDFLRSVVPTPSSFTTPR